MKQHHFINILFLSALAVMVRAQSFEEKPKTLTGDSIKSDFEEWLRNEPLQKEVDKPLAPDLSKDFFIRPLPPSTGITDPRLLAKKEPPPISVVIMTPKLKTDMILAYQGNWLKEKRKEQQGGGMMIGFNPLCLISVAASTLFPNWANRKSKKERQREHLKQVLEHY